LAHHQQWQQNLKALYLHKAKFFISFGTSSTMTAELEGSLPSQSKILRKFVCTILVLMNSLSALVLIYGTGNLPLGTYCKFGS
jgi:hypothetical protein